MQDENTWPLTLAAALLAAMLSTLPSCGTGSPGPSGRQATAESRKQRPEGKAEQPSPAPPRLSCQQRQGRQYIAPAELPTWETGMRVLVNNRCLPCHNRNFAAKGLRLTSYEDYEVTAASSLKRIANGLLKPLASHETFSVQLWLLNGLPRSPADTAAWRESRCVILP